MSAARNWPASSCSAALPPVSVVVKRSRALGGSALSGRFVLSSFPFFDCWRLICAKKMCEMNTKELWPGNPDIFKSKNMSENCTKLITLRVHPAVLVCDHETVFNSFDQFRSLIDKAKYLVVVPTFVATEINNRKLHGSAWAETVFRYLMQSKSYLSFVHDNGKQTEILPLVQPPAMHTRKSDERCDHVLRERPNHARLDESGQKAQEEQRTGNERTLPGPQSRVAHQKQGGGSQGHQLQHSHLQH